STPRPAQQKALINEGIVNSQLTTTALNLNSHANSGDSRSLESLYVSASNGGDPGFTPWYWGEGRGDTRTGMPVAVSAPEISRIVQSCSNFTLGQDPRVWPQYP